MAIAAPLDRERRLRNVVGLAAIAAGFLLAVSGALQLVGPQSKVNETTLGLITTNKRLGLDIGASVVALIGWACVAAALAFVADASRARTPDGRGAFVRWLGIAGPLIAGVIGLATAVVVGAKAHDFVTQGVQSYQQANQLLSGTFVLVLQLLTNVGGLLVAVAFVLVSLGAMRVGLLTRFMGYLGIFAGVLVVFFPIPIPVIQAYWLIAIGYLISGRWPSGVPPAWSTGKAEPWPSNAAIREQRQKAMAERRGGGGGGGAPRRGLFAPRPAPPEPVAPEPQAARGTRATTPKRKRKRRK
jgi:hypothetical protein